MLFGERQVFRILRAKLIYNSIKYNKTCETPHGWVLIRIIPRIGLYLLTIITGRRHQDARAIHEGQGNRDCYN
jgi:hypothetical protein